MVEEEEIAFHRMNTAKLPMRYLGDNTNQNQEEGPGQSDRATQYSKAMRNTEK